MTSYTTFEIQRNRILWNEALREPELGQLNGHLANAEYTEFCCLGVACERVPALGIRRATQDDTNTGMWTYQYDPVDGIIDTSVDDPGWLDATLPKQALAALGLNDDMQTFLIGLNDTAKLPFPQIADVIEVMPIVGASDAVEPVVWDEWNFLQYHKYLFESAKVHWWQETLSRTLSQIESLTRRSMP